MTRSWINRWLFLETWAWAACGQTCTSFIRRKFRIYVNPKRRQNGFVWKVDTWISNKLRWIVSRNVECSFESFWCLQEKLYHWRRKFNWLRKHFKIEIRGIFLNVVDYGPQNFFFLLWSIFHLVIISQLKALFSCKVGHKLRKPIGQDFMSIIISSTVSFFETNSVEISYLKLKIFSWIRHLLTASRSLSHGRDHKGSN